MIFRVSFQYSESVYCSNLAISDNAKAVEAHYSKYAWYHIEEGNESDLKEAEEKGKPILRF